MTPYASIPLLALVVLVQTTVMPAASLGATKPFLPLLVIVSWGLVQGSMAAAWWALALGLMLDLVSPSPFLFYTLPLMLVVGVVAVGRGRFFPTNLLLPWLVAAAATAAFVLGQWSLLLLTDGPVAWHGEAVARALFPETALNLLWLPLAYFPLRAVSRRLRGPHIEWER